MRIQVLALTALLIQPLAAEEVTIVRSTAADRSELGLTVYNVGRGLIRESRTLNLPKGLVSVEAGDVAARVMPPTVAVEPGKGATVLEQNYEYDLLSPAKLLEKFVGEVIELELRRPFGEGGEGTELLRQSATLLSVEGGTVWRMNDGVVINPPYERIFFPRVPGNLRERPTLVWLLDVDKAGPRTIETSYLSLGLNWSADYVLALDENGKEGGLGGWITLDNKSGTGYEDATLRLVAGEPNIARPEVSGDMQMMAMRSAKAGVQEESFGEYHLYTVPRPVTVKDNQTKQVRLLETDGISIRRRYKVDVGGGYHLRMPYPNVNNHEVRTYLEIDNSADNELGMPLPAGIVRVYRAHHSGASLFVGEDRIGHTPKDETVTLQLGTSFDLVTTVRQTDYEKLADRASESAWEALLRNHKDHDVVIEVVAPASGDWDLVSFSHEGTKVDARTLRFDVSVPADAEVELTWRIRSRW